MGTKLLNRLILVGVFFFILAGCSSQQEQRISALHHFNKGNASYRIEDYPRAVTHYRKALEHDEEAPDVYYNLGLTYLVTENHIESIKAFQRALEINPNLPDAHYNLALAFDKIYNPSAAHYHYNAYREMMLARKKKPSGKRKTIAAANRKNQPRGKSKTFKTRARSGTGKPSASASTLGNPGAKQYPQVGYNQSAPIHSVTKDQPILGGNQKWWTQDRYIQPR